MNVCVGIDETEITEGDNVFILNQGKGDLDNYIKEQYPDDVEWERDPDDGLPVWDISPEAREQHEESFVLEYREEWQAA